MFRLKCLVKISLTQIVRPVQSIELTSLTYTLKSDLSGSCHIQRTSLKVQTLLKKKERVVLCKQRNGDAVPFPFLGGGIFSAPQHLRFTEWLMMCREGNKQQEQMTSEAAKSLVSIANVLIRMEKGRNKKKKTESTKQKNA